MTIESKVLTEAINGLEAIFASLTGEAQRLSQVEASSKAAQQRLEATLQSEREAQSRIGDLRAHQQAILVAIDATKEEGDVARVEAEKEGRRIVEAARKVAERIKAEAADEALNLLRERWKQGAAQ